MSPPPEATRHNNSTKLLILLYIRANSKSIFQYETPCIIKLGRKFWTESHFNFPSKLSRKGNAPLRGFEPNKFCHRAFRSLNIPFNIRKTHIKSFRSKSAKLIKFLSEIWCKVLFLPAPDVKPHNWVFHNAYSQLGLGFAYAGWDIQRPEWPMTELIGFKVHTKVRFLFLKV